MDHSINNIASLISLSLDEINGQQVIKVILGKKLTAKEKLMSSEAEVETSFTLWPIKDTDNQGNKKDAKKISQELDSLKFKLNELVKLYLTKEDVLEVLIGAATKAFGDMDDPNFEANYKKDIVKQSKLDIYFKELGERFSQKVDKADLSKPARFKIVRKGKYLNLPSYGSFVEDASIPLEKTSLSMSKKEDEAAFPPEVPQDPAVIQEQVEQTNDLFR